MEICLKSLLNKDGGISDINFSAYKLVFFSFNIKMFFNLHMSRLKPRFGERWYFIGLMVLKSLLNKVGGISDINYSGYK